MTGRGRITRMPPRVLATLAILAAMLLGGFIGQAAPAAAAETVIGFDHFPGAGEVPAGTIVTKQWEPEGLKLGTAEAVGDPAHGAGNCGPPSVKRETVVIPAVSAPNYAVLPSCISAGPLVSGTYGALVNHPRGSLSVAVRSLSNGFTAKVIVTTFNSLGVEVAHAEHSNVPEGSWTPITVADSARVPISYFSITAELPNQNEVGIDNLSFEKVEEEAKKEEEKEKQQKEKEAKEKGGGGGSTGGSGSTPPTPPTATLALATPNSSAGQPITLSGAGSSAGSGHIVSYGWNFGGGSKEETSTGTDPEAHVMFSPGLHTVTMIVTNSNHEKSTTHLGLSLPTSLKAHIPDGGEGECQPTLEIGDAHLLAECIQKLGNGYVIEGDLEINGTMLVPKGGGFLKIKTVRNYALGGGNETELYGAQVDIQLENTPLGSMVLGERNLETEPIPLEEQGGLPPKFEGIFHDFTGPRGHAAAGGGGGGGGGGGSQPVTTGGAKPTKQLLYVFGVGKNCKAGETKEAGCCPPPNGHIVCAEIPGNFPITGLVDVYLNNKGQTLLYVQVGLSLKEVNLEATGALEIRVNNENGIELQSLKFEIGEAALKPIFKIKGASFEYYFPSYEEESKADTWQAKGTITFGEEVAKLKAEMAFKKGNFKKAAMSLKITPGVPIYAGIFLNEIGATLAVEPLEFGGSLGASIAEVLELELEFRYREQNEHPPELGYFGGEGRLSFKENQIASLAADVYSDGYVDAALKIQLSLPFGSKEPVAEVRGGLSFWDETNNPHGALWQVQGEAYLKIWIIEIEGQVLVNNEYVAGCAAINGFGAQGHYSFKDSGIGGGFFAFSNCSDQLKEFKEKPATKHSGGFVKEESARFLPKTGNALSALGGSSGPIAVAAAGGESETFNLPEGAEGQELRVSSSSGVPIVHLAGPGGQSYTTPAAVKQVSSVPGQFIAALAPNPNQVLILLKHPKGGQWTISTLPGSGPLSRLETAEDVAPASVRVHVRHSRRGGYALAYNIAHHVPGTAVRFVERGKDSTHVLGTVTGAHGTLRFTPEEALSPNRSIVAYLLDHEGVEMRELPVGHYAAPRPLRPGRPRKVRIARRKNTALLTWSAVPGARSYRVKITGSDGRLETHILEASAHSVPIPNVLGFESFTATVTAVGGKDKLPGPAVTAKLKPVKTKRLSSAKRPASKRKR
jgi:PKD repeat protein